MPQSVPGKYSCGDLFIPGCGHQEPREEEHENNNEKIFNIGAFIVVLNIV
jgi:hypothetical protein